MENRIIGIYVSNTWELQRKLIKNDTTSFSHDPKGMTDIIWDKNLQSKRIERKKNLTSSFAFRMENK